MRALAQFIVLFMIWVPCFGQNLIGHDVKYIKKYMAENRIEMNPEKVTNMKFSYLKYSDNSGSQTILFFLGSDSVCKGERLIIDQRLKSEKIKEFNSVYKKKGENTWIDSRDGRNIVIQINDEAWTSIVTIVPEK